MASPVPDPDVYWKIGHAILAGTVQALTDAAIPVPALQYVTTRGPMFLETDCGCDQLFVQLGTIADPAEFADPRDKCASRFEIVANVVYGQCITEWVGTKGLPCLPQVGDPGDPCGDPFVPPTAPAQGEPATLAYETWLAARVRWVMANGVARCVEEALCACAGLGPPAGRLCHAEARRGLVVGEAEGLCEWSDLTLAVRV